MQPQRYMDHGTPALLKGVICFAEIGIFDSQNEDIHSFQPFRDASHSQKNGTAVRSQVSWSHNSPNTTFDAILLSSRLDTFTQGGVFLLRSPTERCASVLPNRCSRVCPLHGERCVSAPGTGDIGLVDHRSRSEVGTCS